MEVRCYYNCVFQILMNAKRRQHVNVQIANAKTHGVVMSVAAVAICSTWKNTTHVSVSPHSCYSKAIFNIRGRGYLCHFAQTKGQVGVPFCPILFHWHQSESQFNACHTVMTPINVSSFIFLVYSILEYIKLCFFFSFEK